MKFKESKQNTFTEYLGMYTDSLFFTVTHHNSILSPPRSDLIMGHEETIEC